MRHIFARCCHLQAMMLSRELTDSEWAEVTRCPRTAASVSRSSRMRILSTSRDPRRRDRRRSTLSTPSDRTATIRTIRSHRQPYTGARHSPRSARTPVHQLTICISGKVGFNRSRSRAQQLRFFVSKFHFSIPLKNYTNSFKIHFFFLYLSLSRFCF